MEVKDRPILFKPTKGMLDVPTHYCPGCTHGVIHRLIGEVMEELDIIDKTIGVAPVGCSVLAYDYFACDMFEAAHGRAPAVATGIKRANPDKIVFTYQGDGDLAANWPQPHYQDKRPKPLPLEETWPQLDIPFVSLKCWHS